MTITKNDSAAIGAPVAELDGKVARFEDALQHIAKVCEGSRQRTRRIRWIEQRALCAINNSDAWKTLDLPKREPAVLHLETMIASVYDIAKREIEGLRDVYENDGEVMDERAKEDLKVLEKFVRDARYGIESIRHYEENQEAVADGR